MDFEFSEAEIAFGEEVEPVFQRLGLFCRQLAANRFIELTGWPGDDPAIG